MEDNFYILGHNGKAQGSCTTSVLGKDFKAVWGFKICASSSFEEAQREGQC